MNLADADRRVAALRARLAETRAELRREIAAAHAGPVADYLFAGPGGPVAQSWPTVRSATR
jgi:hypothetical protein